MKLQGLLMLHHYEHATTCYDLLELKSVQPYLFTLQIDTISGRLKQVLVQWVCLIMYIIILFYNSNFNT